jgi:hypothetical protein
MKDKEVERHIVAFENACTYGVPKGGSRLVLSWSQLEKVISYFLANGSRHVGGGKPKPF